MAAARSERHAGEDDDVRDPIGQPPGVHAEVGAVIVEILLPVLVRIAVYVPPDAWSGSGLLRIDGGFGLGMSVAA
jgi:hypothetical protein